MVDVVADSGAASDIQDAVDLAVVGDSVKIPTGVHEFVPVGGPWVTVTVPAGINVFGAPTSRDGDGQVIDWGTSLVMPYEAPSFSIWFLYNVGSNLGFRFSDIELVGYRQIDNDSITMYTGLEIDSPYTEYPTEGYLDFRVDHCNFQDLGGNGVAITGHAEYNRRVFRGVIDHNRFTNVFGHPGYPTYEDRTLGYGISMRKWACDLWESDVTNVLGQYTNYTIVIEDNYFSKWRHCVASNDGFHYVFRNNIVENDYGTGSVDSHGSYADATKTYAVGTRAVEIYNNTFKDPDTTYSEVPWASNHRGGAAIMYNNTLENYYALCHLNNDAGNYAPYRPDCHINDTYLWSNSMGGAINIGYNWDNTENVNYFLRAPTVEDDGWGFTPYEYPHPLIGVDGEGFEMESEKHAAWTKKLTALKRHRGQWGTEQTLFELICLLEDVLDTLEP